MSSQDDDVPTGFSSPDGLKRGSDHFMTGTNENYMGDQIQQKRVKLEALPSKVLHIRNLPEFASEADVITLGIPFGKVTNVLRIPTNRNKGAKPQAFLEMESEEKATAMVNYYTYVAASIRGENVFVQYSKHSEIKTDPAKQSPVIAGLLSAAAAASAGELGSLPLDIPGGNGYSPMSKPPAPPMTQQMAMGNVLRVVVDNMLYPVSIDALNIIFSKYGTVIKIVICTKTNQFQVFVQYPDHVPANAAKSALDGQNIYNGCCTMKIGFSKFSDLNVKYNNDKTRDFSRPDLPSGEGQPQFDPNLGLSALGAAAGFLTNPFLAAGAAAAANVPNLGLMGPGNIPNLLQGMGSNPAMSAPLMGNDHRHSRESHHHRGGSREVSVLLVSQLCAEKINCDDLFTLFGAYGDVMRVKILYNKPDTALIQFAEPMQAEISRENLNGVPFQGKTLKVSSSKHDSVSMPREGSEGSHLTKDFGNSPIHRFRKYGSKNYQNIYPPSRTLHLSNIPSTQTEEGIRLLFTEKTEGKMSQFQFFTKGSSNEKKMALVEMSTVEEAVQALVDLHDVSLEDNNHLRVSFARKPIRL